MLLDHLQSLSDALLLYSIPLSVCCASDVASVVLGTRLLSYQPVINKNKLMCQISSLIIQPIAIGWFYLSFDSAVSFSLSHTKL